MNTQDPQMRFQIPTLDQVSWFLESMGVRGTSSKDEAPLIARLQSEYQEMLAQRPLEELASIARARRIEVHAQSRQAAVQELAARLCDLGEISVQLTHIRPLGLRMLLYLHLVLTPGRGLSAGNALRECAIRLDSSYLDPSQQRTTGENESDLMFLDQEAMGDLSYVQEDLEQRQSRRRISAQLASLSERGLVLPFKQHNATYYSVPLAVRACLPPQLCLPTTTFSPETPEVREATYDQFIDELYALWATVASRVTLGRAIIPPPEPARQPVEDQWAALEGWRHVPSELASVERYKASAQTSSTGSPSLTQSVTVPPAEHNLQEADRLSLSSATQFTEEQIEFYLHLLRALGALQIQPEEPVVISAEQMQLFLSLPREEQVRDLLRLWIAETNWSEMDLFLRQSTKTLPEGKEGTLRLRRSLAYADFKPDNLYREWRSGRLAVLRFLLILPGNQWIPIDHFLLMLWELNSSYLHTQSAPSVWWLESQKTKKQFGSNFDDWQHSYGQFALTVIEKPLAWFGAVKLAYQNSKLAAFRLTPLGRMMLGRGHMPAAEGHLPSTVSFGKDMTVVVVPHRVPLALHELLRSVGKVIRATPQEFVYRLTADGIRQWCESTPLSPAAEKAELEAVIEDWIASLQRMLDELGNETAVPPEWRDLLLTWVRNYGHTHIYQDLTLLDLADDYALQELLASTSLREHILYQFSPRLVAIRPDAVDNLVEEMEKRGYTPRVE